VLAAICWPVALPKIPWVDLVISLWSGWCAAMAAWLIISLLARSPANQASRRCLP